MQEALRKVEAFHTVFGLFLAHHPTADVPAEIVASRVRLFAEELEEYRVAAEAHDLVAVADALSDMLYVLLGTYVTHGLQEAAGALFDEVHRSNMTKLDAEGRPIIRDGKVRKSPLFSEPDLAAILRKYQ